MNNNNSTTKNQYLLLSIILSFALILRIFLSQSEGYILDITYFTNWSQEVFNNGFNNFYQNFGADYPPFYIYILWIIGAISHLFNIDINILLKFPTIIADISTSFLIFHIAKKYTSFNIALFSAIIYAFNPAIIYTSAIWGQVDSIYTFFLLFAVYEFVSDKPITSSMLFTLSVLTKPQSLVLAPLFVILIIKKYSYKMLVKLACISTVIFLFLSKPFYIDSSVSEIFKLYISSYTEYPFTSLNAFNFWALFGMFKPDNITFLFPFLTYRMIGYLLFASLFIYVLCFFLKRNDEKMTYLCSSLLFFGFFMLFTRIHERYLFPMFVFLVIANIFDKRLYIVYILLSITFFANLYLVFEEVKTGVQIPMSMFIVTYSTLINIILFIYVCYCLYSYRGQEHDKLRAKIS